jgi:hypothetical protein
MEDVFTRCLKKTAVQVCTYSNYMQLCIVVLGSNPASVVLGSNPAPPQHTANSVSPEVSSHLGWHSTMCWPLRGCRGTYTQKPTQIYRTKKLCIVVVLQIMHSHIVLLFLHQGNCYIILIDVIFCRLKINHDSHEFILESGTIANSYISYCLFSVYVKFHSAYSQVRLNFIPRITRFCNVPMIRIHSEFRIAYDVPDQEKPESQYRLSAVQNWPGVVGNLNRVGIGRGWERGGQFTSNLGPRWTGSHHAKGGFPSK